MGHGMVRTFYRKANLFTLKNVSGVDSLYVQHSRVFKSVAKKYKNLIASWRKIRKCFNEMRAYIAACLHVRLNTLNITKSVTRIFHYNARSTYAALSVIS